MAWRCKACKRTFGRTNQSHFCEPIDPKLQKEPFADRPKDEQRACAAVLRHLKKLGPVTVEVVAVGVLVKRSRTFVEMRPKRDSLALSFILSDVIDHPRIARAIKISGRRVAHFVELRAASDVDRDVKDWLAESYFASPE
jgi:hypothetical protein